MNHLKRSISLCIILSLCLSLFAGTVVLASADDLSGMTQFTFNGTSVTVRDGVATNYEVVVITADGSESTPDTDRDSNGDTLYSLPSGSAGELQIAIKKAGGSYVFSGTGTASIVVKKAATGPALLYCNGLSLTSAITAPITVNKDSTTTCEIIAVTGTTNTLTDNAYNNADTNTANEVAESAVIKAKAGSNLILSGGGTLNIVGNAKNGIKANGLLTIGGEIRLNVTALDNGISGESVITMNGGYVTITAQEGDGIKCAADDAAIGEIVINGGALTIHAKGDGIQATASLTVNGGVLDITCGGGYTASYNSVTSTSAKGLKASGSYTDDSGAEVDATQCQLTINGGFITINSPDDAIHSDQHITITKGVIDIYTSTSTGDGIHADYTNTIGTQGGVDTDLYITIHTCYEGIEGANVYIHSGIINVFAYDDSINAANSDLGSNYAFSVDMTGGFVYCASSTGDCLDSNKSFTISGGTLVVLGSITSQDNTAVDTDGSFNIRGGTILTIGSNSNMLVNPTTTQNYCSWTSTGTATASASGSSGSGSSTRPGQIQRPGSSGSGSGNGVVGNKQQLTITDADGNVLISVAVQWATNPSGKAGYVLYSSPDLTAGSRYTVTVGTMQTVTGGSNITTPSVAAQPETPEFDLTDPSDDDDNNNDNNNDNDNDTDNQDTPQPELPDGLTKGDVNMDGKIDAGDALLVLQFAVQKLTPTTQQTTVGDVDGNGTLNAGDALWILQYAVGKRASFA